MELFGAYKFMDIKRIGLMDKLNDMLTFPIRNYKITINDNLIINKLD